MMERELLALERGFWTGDRAFYLAHVDGQCLTAFPEMAGVMTNVQIAETVEPDRRWRDVELTVRGLIEPVPDVAILCYEAKAIRANGDPYTALVSSAYVRRSDGWKLVFHQQTPK